MGISQDLIKFQGIGANFIPANFDKELADDVMLISNEEAIEETKTLRVPLVYSLVSAVVATLL